MIAIREAAPEDFPVIQQIAHETWPDTFGAILSEEQIGYMLELMYSTDALTTQIGKLGHIFLLATDETGYVGYLSYELNYKGLSKTKIHKVYILPRTQGKGVGQALLAKVIDVAQQHGNTTLSLNVNRDNRAVGFYQKSGFAVVGREDIAIGNGFLMEDYVMEKSLSLEAV